MSKIGSFFFGDSGPKYDSAAAQNDQVRAAQAQAKYGTYGVDSPEGNVNVVKNPDGTYKRVFDPSSADVTRTELINQGLSGISLDPTKAEDAYYDRATRRLLPKFERDQESLEEQLINQGLQRGTERFDIELEKLRETQGGQLSDIENRAVFEGQDLLSSQIGNVNQLSAGKDIGLLASLGGGTGARFDTTYDEAFKNQQDRQAAREKRNSNIINTGAALFGAFSDERLKENLKIVGKLDNGLKVYVGNYNDKAIELDPTLNKTTQLFLIAQDVKEVNPKAVGEKDGFLTVDYREAVKNDNK